MAARPGVARAEPLGISQTRFQAGDGGTTNVAVFGVAADGGLAPSPVRAGTVVIGSTVASDLSLDVGDTATVGGTDLTVTAVVDDQWYSHTGVVWTALPSWAEVAHLSPAAGGGRRQAVAPSSRSLTRTVPWWTRTAANAAAGTVSASRTGSFQALGSFKSENGSLMLMQALPLWDFGAGDRGVPDRVDRPADPRHRRPQGHGRVRQLRAAGRH